MVYNLSMLKIFYNVLQLLLDYHANGGEMVQNQTEVQLTSPVQYQYMCSLVVNFPNQSNTYSSSSGRILIRIINIFKLSNTYPLYKGKPLFKFMLCFVAVPDSHNWHIELKWRRVGLCSQLHQVAFFGTCNCLKHLCGTCNCLKHLWT